MSRFTNTLIAIAILAVVSMAMAQSAAQAPESKLFDAGKLIEDLRILSADDMEGRSGERPSIEKAREYIERRFKEAGLQSFSSSFRQDVEMSQMGLPPILKLRNLVGSIKGRKHADKYVVISAHYDHLGFRKGEIFNGADDNASGTAALFAIATYFKKNLPDHSLIFVAYDGEEMGLIGSRYFVRNLPVPKESVVLNVNMDMISRNDKRELYAAGSRLYPQLKPALEQAQKKAGVKLLLGHDDPSTGRDDWTDQSDQAAFHAAKIPFIYFGVEDHKDYHKSTDDFANIQPEFYVKAVETIIEAVKSLDTGLTK